MNVSRLKFPDCIKTKACFSSLKEEWIFFCYKLNLPILSAVIKKEKDKLDEQRSFEEKLVNLDGKQRASVYPSI